MLLAKSKFSTDGILVWPKFLCERLIDNRRGRSARRIGGSERAALDQPNLHRRTIIGGDRGELGAPSFSRLRRPLVRSFDFDRRSEPTERHMTSLAYSNHLRQCMEAFQRILTEISQARFVRVLRLGKRELRHHYIRRI